MRTWQRKTQLKEQIISYKKSMHASLHANLFLPMLHEKETKYESFLEYEWRVSMIRSRAQDIEKGEKH